MISLNTPDVASASWTPSPTHDTSRMPAPTADTVRVLLAGADAPARDELAALVVSLGHTLLGAATGREALQRATAMHPEVVLLDVRLLSGPDTVTAEDVEEAAPGAAVVLFSDGTDVRLTDREVGASAVAGYLAMPVRPGQLDSTLRLAVRRVRAYATVRQEADEARRQLEHRKLIERAKGVLMRRTGASEQDAYSMLRRQSQDRSVPMADIARAVLESEPGYGRGA
jgi:two-component system, response regulator PdtaR